MQPIIVGLTGSIGTGKSTAVQMLQEMHIPVNEADHEVHNLLKNSPEIVGQVSKVFPEAVTAQGVDRQKLGELAFETLENLRQLEAILHPAVMSNQLKFVRDHVKDQLVVLDVPLLFEAGFEKYCDYTILMQCDFETQRKRVLERAGMTEERFKKILSNQMTNEDKVVKANYILETSFGKEHTFRRLDEIIKDILEKERF